jgi:hypothetical protein
MGKPMHGRMNEWVMEPYGEQKPETGAFARDFQTIG